MYSFPVWECFISFIFLQTTFYLEGNKLRQKQRDVKNNLETSIDREFVGDELITVSISVYLVCVFFHIVNALACSFLSQTMHCGDVVSVRKYKKVE